MNRTDPAISVSSDVGTVLLEVCVDSVAGARAAEQGGADRIELCANLIEGGTTPSSGMIRAVLEQTRLPVMVMIRPRGGDFCFDREELRTVQYELEAVLELPVAGIVFGALTPDGQIDVDACQAVCRQAANVSKTFHRAFDHTRNAPNALRQLLELPFDRLLTSGQQATAVAGLSLLRELIHNSEGRIRVMPGSGVRPENVRQIVETTGAQEIHFSASELVSGSSVFLRSEVPLSAPTMPPEGYRRITSVDCVRAIREAVQSSG